MKEDEKRLRDLAREESVELQGIRLWRSQHRKRMVDSIERLIAQAEKNAISQYTRSAQRARWTRLAGQLIWYKDQILRAMTWEAIEQENSRLARKVLEQSQRQDRQMAGSPLDPWDRREERCRT